MKLSKKKISFLVSVLSLMIVLIFALCSFDFPTYGTPLSFPDGVSSADRSTLSTVVSLQSTCGGFNSVHPLFCYVSGGHILLYGMYRGTTFNFGDDPQSDYYEFIISGGSFVRFYLCSGGFSYYGISPDSYVSIDKTDVLFFRPAADVGIVFNQCFIPSSESSNQSIGEVFSYWYNFYNQLLLDLDIELESAYDNGYSDGFDTGFDSGYFEGLESGLVWGEELGYQEGYTEGYQEGIGTGYRDGFLAGEAEGYDTGYADGYQDGYDTGYSEAERETIIRYVEPVELDVPRIFNSIGAVPRQVLDGVDFEIFGVPILGVLLSILILTISIFVIRKMK